jgi:hypothetical protein
MRASKRGPLPKDLLRAQSRFQAWRRRHKTDRRVPPALWTLAVALAHVHGVSRTAVALGVNYHGLKKRAGAALAAAAASEPPAQRPAFVELSAPAVLAKQCLFEVSNAAGASLRVQLLGYDRADVESLARAVWSPE